jgi:ABC-type dipeptide/oligopeptide/nickel transport system permease component
MAVIGYGGVGNDPDVLMRIRLSPRAIPLVAKAWGFDNPRVEELGLQQLFTADNASRRAAVQEIQRIVADEVLVAFAVVWPLVPLGGAVRPFAHYSSPLDRLADIASHLALPLAALTASLFGRQVLLVRNTVVGTLGEDYMVLARAKGLPEGLLKFRHAGRNALLPFLTLVGLQAGIAVGGAVFIESVFSYPGMGTLVLRAIEARDYPVLEATFLVLALVVLTANVTVDLLCRRLDPRARAAP